MKTYRIMLALLLAIPAFAMTTNAAEEKGWFGLAFKVETEGFSFNPTIQSVRIEKVSPASPGADAGLLAGDLVVSLQGIAVAGAKADELKLAMNKAVGETLRVKVKRGAAEPLEVPLVAVARPAAR